MFRSLQSCSVAALVDTPRSYVLTKAPDADADRTRAARPLGRPYQCGLSDHEVQHHSHRHAEDCKRPSVHGAMSDPPNTPRVTRHGSICELIVSVNLELPSKTSCKPGSRRQVRTLHRHAHGMPSTSDWTTCCLRTSRTRVCRCLQWINHVEELVQ